MTTQTIDIQAQPDIETDGLRSAVAAITRLCDGDETAWEEVPVPLRAALAATALASSGHRVSGVGLATAGGFSRGTAERTGSPWKGLLPSLSAGASKLLSALDIPEDAPEMGTRAAEEIAKRDRTIADLRAELNELRATVNPLMDYAHDLAVELRNYREHERASLNAKVHHLTPVD